MSRGWRRAHRLKGGKHCCMQWLMLIEFTFVILSTLFIYLCHHPGIRQGKECIFTFPFIILVPRLLTPFHFQFRFLKWFFFPNLFVWNFRIEPAFRPCRSHLPVSKRSKNDISENTETQYIIIIAIHEFCICMYWMPLIILSVSGLNGKIIIKKYL